MKRERMIIAGGSGFLGHVLRTYFLQRGFEVLVLTRSAGNGPGNNRSRDCYWDGRTLGEWAQKLKGADVLINLAGRSVNCRYHARNRQLMMDSRVHSTRVLGEAIARCECPPRVWLNSSTATIYRHTLGPAWDEAGEIGSTPEAKDAFSVEVATAWERVFHEAVTPGTRKVQLRSAMVLGLGLNSVFPMLQRLVRFGLGGMMGSGRQFVSWIHQTDFCRAVEFLIRGEEFSGPVNLASPNPLPNVEMMRILREVCGVPFGLPAPEWMLEIGAFLLRTETELIIKSRRVVPGKLLAADFEFQFPYLRDAFENLCALEKKQ